MSERGTASQVVHLSAGIVTWRSDPARFAATVRSLARALEHVRTHGNIGATMDLAIVDNGAAEAPLPALEQLLDEPTRSTFAHLVLLASPQNSGYGAGQNTALTKTVGEIHLVLNPDVELEEDALHEALRHLRSEPRSVGVAPRGLDEHGRDLYLGKRRPTLLVLLARAFVPQLGRRLFAGRLDRYEMRDVVDAGRSTPVECASGCCMILRRAALERVGGFAPGYFLYFEDFDLSLRLREHGEIRFLPNVRIVHHGGGAARKGIRHVWLFARGLCTFARHHGLSLW